VSDFALSIRQPWASLIVAGLKTIEVRRWCTQYRGRLLIHAAKTIDEVALERFPIENPILGALIGSATLVDVEQFTPASWRANAGEHLQLGRLQEALFAWHIFDPLPFRRPIPCRGELGLFHVSLSAADATQAAWPQWKSHLDATHNPP
jgi:hypothetical protein